jgi:peroxiredoxin
MPDIGELAPDFTLQSTRGVISLRQFGGGKKLVLAFYIEDGTPG